MEYKYKYNGKEWQDELGLNVYDYGARFYMPDIGRMGSMDALSEKYYPISPNAYALNNPMYFVDPDGNYIEIYFKHGDREYSERYEYVKDRDYSKMSGFKADAYKALDALYNASTIEIDGEQVNVMQTLMDSEKELSVVKGGEVFGSHFAGGREYKKNGKWKDGSSKVIGTIHFNNTEGVLYDDVNGTPSDVLLDLLSKNKLPKTAKVNSPTSVLGHELIHGFNHLKSVKEKRERQNSGPVHFGPIRFKNQEEAKATTLSSQINIQLGENPRNNHRAAGVRTKGVLSTEIIH